MYSYGAFSDQSVRPKLARAAATKSAATKCSGSVPTVLAPKQDNITVPALESLSAPLCKTPDEQQPSSTVTAAPPPRVLPPPARIACLKPPKPLTLPSQLRPSLRPSFSTQLQNITAGVTDVLHTLRQQEEAGAARGRQPLSKLLQVRHGQLQLARATASSSGAPSAPVMLGEDALLTVPAVSASVGSVTARSSGGSSGSSGTAVAVHRDRLEYHFHEPGVEVHMIMMYVDLCDVSVQGCTLRWRLSSGGALACFPRYTPRQYLSLMFPAPSAAATVAAHMKGKG